MSAGRLRDLAERAGIAAAYHPAGGGPRRVASDDVRRRLLRALGVDLDAPDPVLPESARARGSGRGTGRHPRCPSPAQRLGRSRGFGLWANLYSLRGAGSIGVGNLGALRTLVRLAADAGACFVGVSPLHATRNLPPDVSPYQPLSRFFGNPLYLDVRAAPEWRMSAAARRELDAPPGIQALRALEAAGRIDYERAGALQRRVLEHLHTSFQVEQRNRDSPRARDYRHFAREGGDRLRDFATFCALEDELATRGVPRDWRRWPPEFQTPDGAAVRRFRSEQSGRVAFHIYCQFELTRQRAALAEEGRALGLEIGLYPDLAVGSGAAGFDTWAFPDQFVSDVSVGAPPDDYARQGQDWGFPPLHPWQIAVDGCAFWRDLLRANAAHAGMLRIDHVLGVARQFWIPAGEPASRGAYVKFPAVALLRALAEESRRSDTVIVGEDLGTVPRGFPSLLARFGVLSSRVFFFERTRSGGFRPAHTYPDRVLAALSTHDLPPLAAFWWGRDLELRREIGLVTAAADVEAARAERDRARAALLRRLGADGLLSGSALEQRHPPYEEVCVALHRFLCRTPAPLIAVSIDDLAAETEPVNLPGVSAEHFPSWTRRMERPVEALAQDPLVERALAALEPRANPSG